MKRFQSAEDRKPAAPPDACVMESVLAEKERGPETEAAVMPPVPLPVSNPPRVVEPVPPMFTPKVVEADHTPPLMTATPESAEESIPVPPFEVARVPLMVESVVVATHDGRPLASPRTNPLLPTPSLLHAFVALP